MIRQLVYTTLIILYASILAAQVKIVKPAAKTKPVVTRLGISGGVTSSVLILERNINQNNSATGYHAGIVYGINRILRLSAGYTSYKTIHIVPTWYDIKASTLELNFHTIARMKDVHAYFYPLFGISYNVFKGHFTGRGDHLNLFRYYQQNEDVHTRWFGLNIGTGLEFVIRPFSVYGEFKMRIGQTEVHQINILDVCFSAGVRYNIKVPTLHKIFHGTRSRYLLDTRDEGW
jgi:hypothetical protein